MQALLSTLPARRSVSDNFPLRCVHLDFHTDKDIYDVGVEFDEKEYVSMLKSAQVEFIRCFAMCNQGFAYYPTRAGIPHPGLKTDLFGRMAVANAEAGIKTCTYFSAGLSNHTCARHPEWCKRSKDGAPQASLGRQNDRGHSHPTFLKPCLNTGFGDLLATMAREVMTAYPVNGLFFDNLNTIDPCYCATCLAMMKNKGIDPRDEAQAWNFLMQTHDAFRIKIGKLVDSLKSKNEFFTLTFNGLSYSGQPSHMELEFPQVHGPVYADQMMHYLRALDKPFITMIGRFAKSWGDINGLGTELSLLYNFYKSISNGGSCMMGDHGNVRRGLEPAVYKMATPAFQRIKALAPWCSHARPEADIAVLDPYVDDMPMYKRWRLRTGGTTGGIRGAVMLLTELHCQFDIISGVHGLEKYKVVILPDLVVVDEGLKLKLRDHLQRGGAIISSGRSGLKPDFSGFAMEEYCLKYEGEQPYRPVFFTANGEAKKDVPDMPLTIYPTELAGKRIINGISMSVLPGAEEIATLWKPYFNSNEFDGSFSKEKYVYCEKPMGKPAVIKAGNIIHFSFFVFSGYAQHGVPAYSALFRNCLNMLHPDPLITVSGAPSFAQVNITARDTERMVHIVSFPPEYKGDGNAWSIACAVKLENVKVSLKKRPNRTCASVYLAPERRAIPFALDGGHINFTVPEVNGYQMIVCEETIG